MGDESQVVILKYKSYWWALVVPMHITCSEVKYHIDIAGWGIFVPFVKVSTCEGVPAYRGWSKRRALAHATGLVISGYGTSIIDFTDE